MNDKRRLILDKHQKECSEFYKKGFRKGFETTLLYLRNRQFPFGSNNELNLITQLIEELIQYYDSYPTMTSFSENEKIAT